MKKCFFIHLVLLMVFILTISVSSVSGSESINDNEVSITTPGLPTDTTVTVTIVKIDLSVNSITLKDQSGKLYTFVVDPQVIDLRRFRVGQSVTATISTTWTTNKVTRARITKSQLIKLQ